MTVPSVGDIKPNGDLEFVIYSSMTYLDLSSMYLKLTVLVVKAARAVLVADDIANIHVFPVDNFNHSLLAKMTVSLEPNIVEYSVHYSNAMSKRTILGCNAMTFYVRPRLSTSEDRLIYPQIPV